MRQCRGYVRLIGMLHNLQWFVGMQWIPGGCFRICWPVNGFCEKMLYLVQLLRKLDVIF